MPEMKLSTGRPVAHIVDTPGMDPRIRRNFQQLSQFGVALPYGDGLEVDDGELVPKVAAPIILDASGIGLAVMDRAGDSGAGTEDSAALNALFDAMQAAGLMDTWDIVDDVGDSIYWNDGAGTTGQLVA